MKRTRSRVKPLKVRMPKVWKSGKGMMAMRKMVRTSHKARVGKQLSLPFFILAIGFIFSGGIIFSANAQTELINEGVTIEKDAIFAEDFVENKLFSQKNPYKYSEGELEILNYQRAWEENKNLKQQLAEVSSILNRCTTPSDK